MTIAGEEITVVECAVCDRRRCPHCDMPVAIDAAGHCGRPFLRDVEAAIGAGRLPQLVDRVARDIEQWLETEAAA